MDYVKISSKGNVISLGTTSARLGDPRRVYPEILKSLVEFRKENQCWNKEDQEKFANLLGKNEIFYISADTVVGSAKDVRGKTAFLEHFGFTNKRIISNVGKELLHPSKEASKFAKELNLSIDSFLYLKQFLKYQDKDRDFELLPLISLIYSCLELENNLHEDFLTFIWPTTKNKKELQANLENFKKSKNVYETIYLDCLNSNNTKISKDNCRKFFSKYSISDTDRLNELLYQILPHGKSETFIQKKVIPLFNDLLNYWINKGRWDKKKKKEFILDKLKSRYKDILSKKPKDYLFPLFDTDKFDNSSNWEEIINFFEEKTDLMTSQSHKDFIINFHILFMYIKKISLCYEYKDLNVRHLKLLDIFIFEHNTVKLDMLFQYLFKPVKKQLLDLSILSKEKYKTHLQSPHRLLSDIYSFLKVDTDRLIYEISKVHPEVKDLGVINFTNKLREERLSNLIHKVFTKDNLIILLESIYPRDEKKIRKLIKDWYSPYDAKITALFEYLLGISFYWIFQKKIKISDVLSTQLDSNLLPKSHASGGRADLVIKSSNKDYLVEATLSENDGQRKMEAEPVPRHLARYILDNRNDSLALFIAGKLDFNNLVALRNYKFNKWYSNEDIVDSMNILPLSIDNIIFLLKNDLDFEDFEHIIEKLLNSDTKDGKIWYETEINREFSERIQ